MHKIQVHASVKKLCIDNDWEQDDLGDSSKE